MTALTDKNQRVYERLTAMGQLHQVPSFQHLSITVQCRDIHCADKGTIPWWLMRV